MSRTIGNPARGAGAEAALAAGRLNDSVWFERGIRLGLVAYGVIHILIGWLALQLAFGDRSGSPDQQGALHQVAQQSLGDPLLWLIGVGLLVLAIWQVFEAIWGHRKRDEPKRTFKRISSAGRVVLYAVLGVTAIRMAVQTSSSGGSSTDSMTAKLMDQTAGRWLVAAVGILIWLVAVSQVKRGVTKSFTHDLTGDAVSGDSGTAVEKLGQVGYVAKGVALTVVGALFVWAARYAETNS
jgi:hypothetical protein